jgi:hypothetical protein
MFTKKILTVLAAAASLTCLTATHALAQTVVVSSTTSTTSSGSRLPDDALVTRYTLLAGSKTNAQSLVIGLRTGSTVTLAPSTTATTPAVSFTPTTKKMGYGNINIALALAKTALAKQGITNPTPAQLAAALNGGNITLTNGTVVTMTGILTQRSAGMGWGKIAQTMNVKLGTVVSASQITIKTSLLKLQTLKTNAPASTTTTATTAMATTKAKAKATHQPTAAVVLEKMAAGTRVGIVVVAMAVATVGVKNNPPMAY